MAQWLKQSTAITIQLGPFLDEDDGKTAETGLTVEDSDVFLSKNGAAFANPNDTDDAAHDASGWYQKALDATDTGTLGRLIVMCHKSGALPVRREFMVVPANEYDSLISGSDDLEVDLVSNAITQAKIAADSIGSSELKADAITEIAAGVWEALQASYAGAGTFGEIATEIATILADLVNGGRLDLLIDAILADTDELQTDDVPGLIGALNDPTAGAIADAVWDEALADHDTEDTVGNVLNDLVEESGGTYRFTSAAIQSTLGAGAITFTYTLTSSVDAAAIASATVWVTTDQAGSNVVASGTTDTNGQVVFYLDAGTYYVWREKAGWNFSNPDTETVA